MIFYPVTILVLNGGKTLLALNDPRQEQLRLQKVKHNYRMIQQFYSYMLERNENTVHRKTGTAMFKAAPFVIAKK